VLRSMHCHWKSSSSQMTSMKASSVYCFIITSHSSHFIFTVQVGYEDNTRHERPSAKVILDLLVLKHMRILTKGVWIKAGERANMKLWSSFGEIIQQRHLLGLTYYSFLQNSPFFQLNLSHRSDHKECLCVVPDSGQDMRTVLRDEIYTFADRIIYNGCDCRCDCRCVSSDIRKVQWRS
jgi:hypothetical protein